jgi:hypothetical protein
VYFSKQSLGIWRISYHNGQHPALQFERVRGLREYIRLARAMQGGKYKSVAGFR